LSEKLEEEKSLELEFAQMPEHFMEISAILLETCDPASLLILYARKTTLH